MSKDMSWFSGKWTLWGSIHSIERFYLNVNNTMDAWKAAPMVPRSARTS